jgi:phage gp29-like protein
MVQKDAHLAGVVETRESTLTALDYQIVSAAEVSEVEERGLADEAAEYTRSVLGAIDSFDEALEHLATATCTNLAATEIVWDGNKPVDLVPVEGSRLRMDDQTPGLIRVITEEEAAGVPAQWSKFITHIPKPPRWHPMRRSLLRAQAFVWLTKILAIVDWATFCEVFGMPIRWATYGTSVTPEEKQELIEMMALLGSKAYGVFSEGVRLEMKESSQRGTQPYEALVDWCDRKQTILFLRGNLGTDTTGGTGTYAAAAVQDAVREDVLQDDIKREARTMRRDLFGPICQYGFWRDVPLPYFQRVRPDGRDRKALGELMELAQRIGLRLGADAAYEQLELRKPEAGEAILVPSYDQFGQGAEEGVGYGD